MVPCMLTFTRRTRQANRHQLCSQFARAAPRRDLRTNGASKRISASAMNEKKTTVIVRRIAKPTFSPAKRGADTDTEPVAAFIAGNGSGPWALSPEGRAKSESQSFRTHDRLPAARRFLRRL